MSTPSINLFASFPTLRIITQDMGEPESGSAVYKIAKRFKRNPQIPPGSMSRFHNPRMPSPPGSPLLAPLPY
jgi:hypothetical protein